MNTQTHNLDIFDTYQKPATSPTATKEEINALHLQFSEYGQNAKHWLRQCQMLLPRIRDEEVWKKKGFSSIYEYAAKLAGMSHNSVNEALRVYDALQDKPILKGEVEKHGTHKVKTILTVATQDTQEFWLERLNEMSKSTLETYVRGYKKNLQNGLPGEGQRVQERNEDMSNNEFGLGDSENGGNKGGNSEARTRQTTSIYMKLEVEVIEKLKRMKGDRDWNELMKDFIKSNEKPEMRSEDDNKIEKAQPESAIRESEEKPSPVNTGKRYVPKKIQKYVTNKTSGLCAYPGCSKPYEILHHTERFALNPTHDPDTIKPLCKAHERLAHKGLIENEELVPVEFMTDEGGSLSKVCNVGEESCCTINWSLRTDPDVNNPKYAIDEKVNEYYMPKLK